jgi:lipopolysaccharide transport system permease protein
MAESAVEAPAAPLSPRILGPARHRVRITDIWTTRGVAWMIGIRDIKAKYKQAALGPLWLVIAPLGMLGAVTIAFSGVTDVKTGGIPYLLFAMCGLTVWTFVQLSLTLGAQAISANGQLVRRSPLPRMALITGSMLGNMPPFGVMLTFTLAGTALFYHLPVQALLFPLLAVWLFVFTFGTMLIMSALAARFRDMIAILPLVIQAGIFVTPVGYSMAGAPPNIHTLLVVNPVSGLIEAWRWSLLGLAHPETAAIATSAIWTVVLLISGWRIFGRMEVEFADYV